MTRVITLTGSPLCFASCLVLSWIAVPTLAQPANPVLQTVFPPGGQAGTSVVVALSGSDLADLRDLRTTIPQALAKKLDASTFRLDIPKNSPTGVHDLRAVGKYGMSSPRAFFVSNRAEVLEVEPNDQLDAAQRVPLDVVVNGRIEKPGDVDCYQFKAKAGQRVVLECWAERIDSKLRAVLEVYDAAGTRLAANRGHTGIDPLVDLQVRTEGTYCVKVFDLSYLGSAAHFYRLAIDTQPRVDFAFPNVVTRGTTKKIKLFGRNLVPSDAAKNGLDLDCVEIALTPPPADLPQLLPYPRRPAQVSVDAFAYHHPGCDVPVLISVTDVPVTIAQPDHHAPDHAQELAIPCEVNGQLTDPDEHHWYALNARRGEVFWVEAFGTRLGSPVDLAVTIHEPTRDRELLKLSATVENLGGYRFPTSHADSAGRWIAPADGHYKILVRNLMGGLQRDPRRIYRLSVRREEPDFHLAVISRRTNEPGSLNVPRGGREWLEVLAFRRRGLSGPIRISAEDLAPGLKCPDVWIGPEQDLGIVVLTAARGYNEFVGALRLVGHAESGGAKITRLAQGGSMIWPGQTVPSGRLTQEIPLATCTDASLLLSASPSDAVVDQESVLDVAVDLEYGREGSVGPVHLSGVGLPRHTGNSLATLLPGQSRGWISFAFPATLPPGPYTFAVKADTTVTGGAGKGGVMLVSNPITVTLRPARIVLEIDPHTPRKIARGKVMQLRYTAERKHGFIGKIHTELVAPGGVVGLRARGVTLVGQSTTGTLQVIATEDAPLGRQHFLRLDAVGTVEDQPVYRASRFVDLEIVE